MENDNNDDGGERFIVKLRGLPWNSTAKDVLDFLENVEVIDGEKGVHMSIGRDGRASGEAFAELATGEDLDTAFSYNKNMIGHRYIEGEWVNMQKILKLLKNLFNQFSMQSLKNLTWSFVVSQIPCKIHS